MRCYKCKASCTVHYAESYATDWYCNAGVAEDEMTEDRNGELGCNLRAKTIQQRIDANEQAWLKDKADFVEWMQKQGNI